MTERKGHNLTIHYTVSIRKGVQGTQKRTESKTLCGSKSINLTRQASRVECDHCKKQLRKAGKL